MKLQTLLLFAFLPVASDKDASTGRVRQDERLLPSLHKTLFFYTEVFTGLLLTLHLLKHTAEAVVRVGLTCRRRGLGLWMAGHLWHYLGLVVNAPWRLLAAAWKVASQPPLIMPCCLQVSAPDLRAIRNELHWLRLRLDQLYGVNAG